ncbi:peptidyl-prolyl cis-trans isomerase-like 3 isoform X1 [Danio aesculapii]|uniref:peptidyl-prolyl cis-trans isomerase-like 3 isoform X1 n=1 Tax=Danio aesculapii TaxID=1142201 RepID=UPI0024C03208|nr:peptidyl-prolyl cis-trans isomerase-like 3 isoform X1 [Danio aesculapii]
MNFYFYYCYAEQHRGSVASTIASHQEGRWFESRLGQLAFLCGLCKFSLCCCGFPPGAPVSPTVQTCAIGTGKGGTSIWGRKFEDEFSEHLKHNVRGVVAMANNGPNTNASQFFFTYAKQPHLDMKYTVFGKIIDGLETLDEVEKLPVNEKTFRPLNDVRIKDVTIHANPFAG